MPPKNQHLSPSDVHLLVKVSLSAASTEFSAEIEKVDRLVALGYLVRDPSFTSPAFRLTIQGWAAVRKAGGKPRPAHEEGTHERRDD